MIKYLQHRFALTEDGAKDLIKGVIFTTLLNLALMLPMIYFFIFIDQYFPLEHQHEFTTTWGFFEFTALGLFFCLIIYTVAIFQYDSVYTAVYDESSNRRIHLAEKLRKLPLSFFGKKNLSDLSATLMNDATDLEHTFSHAVPQLMASIFSISLAFTGLFIYNWKLSLALFWVIPISVICIFISKKKMNKSNIKIYEQKRAVTEKIQEGIDLVQEIKSYHQENNYDKELDKEIELHEKDLIKGELMNGALVNLTQVILKLGLPSVIIVGSYLLIQSQISIFVFLVFLTLGTQIYTPVHELFNNLAALFFLDVRIRRMNEIQEIPSQDGIKSFTPLNYNIEFNHVSFSYEEGTPVLEDVSFTAKQGEITALIGPSGGGKSTATRLAARFWDVKKGNITLGSKDIKDVDPETLLESYSIVFQDVVLFNSSIMDNIRIGRKDATDQEVMNAAKLAQCEDFIQELPQKYDTVISENGETLSGGERQRLSIARALLKDAPIILLDEATASLDVENESKIQKAITRLIKDKTVIIIAHKMRTIANAQKIVVLKGGKVAEEGTPKELMQENGLFYSMMNEQNLTKEVILN